MNTRRWLESILFEALDKAIDEYVVLDGGRRVQPLPQHGPRILGREQPKAPQGKLLRSGKEQGEVPHLKLAA